jgi:hypothetical protein
MHFKNDIQPKVTNLENEISLLAPLINDIQKIGEVGHEMKYC